MNNPYRTAKWAVLILIAVIVIVGNYFILKDKPANDVWSYFGGLALCFVFFYLFRRLMTWFENKEDKYYDQ